MATATVPMTKTNERSDVAYGFKFAKDKEGKLTGEKELIVTTPEQAEELEKDGRFSGNIVTVSVDYPATFDALVELANTPVKGDDGELRNQDEVKDELVKLFRAGAKIKVNNRRNAILTKTDEKGQPSFSDEALVNGVLDLTGEITSGSKRVFLTEEEKTWRNLSNLPGALRKQMFDVYLTSIGKEAGQYPSE